MGKERALNCLLVPIFLLTDSIVVDRDAHFQIERKRERAGPFLALRQSDFTLHSSFFPLYREILSLTLSLFFSLSLPGGSFVVARSLLPILAIN